ncbi:MAG: ComEC/Rec2 family competence protein [bacterium]|nr:ComEC/Rec2 family competence protein [bacterium]
MVFSKLFFYFCLSFLAGIFFNSFLNFTQLYLLGFLILGVFLVSVFWQHKKIAFAGFILLAVLAGVWREQSVEDKISGSELRQYNDGKEAVFLTGKVVAEPDVRETNVKLTFQPRQIQGKVLVTTFKYPEYKYGDVLKIKGVLEEPGELKEEKSSSRPFTDAREIEGFDYQGYLAKDGIYSVSYFPEVELLEREKGSVFYSRILDFKEKLRGVIERNLSPPHSSILSALILGDKRQISDDWKEKLNLAGLRHLTAVSGMHVAILTVILMNLFLGFGLWRRQAILVSLFLIALFIIITGLQASALRAGIMGGLFLLGQYFGRTSFSPRLIIIAAFFMLLANPLLLRYDVGFQLSFLAMMGIIYLGPIFQKWLRIIPEFLQLRSIVAMTFSAQAFTLPLLIYNFGYFSLVSPLTNVLAVPLLPFLMGLGFIFVLLGAVFQPLGWILSLPVWLLLNYLVKIIEWFSQLPFSAIFTSLW